MRKRVHGPAAAAGFTVFEFDILQPLIDQLKERLNTVDPIVLNENNTENIPERAQGVYQLFVNNELKYVGKSDADSGLRARLTRHCKKMKHRVILRPDSVFFRAAEVPVFSVMDLESGLIEEYQRDGASRLSLWNGSGFGANDPGRQRDTSAPGKFDRDYPIDIDFDISVDDLGLTSNPLVIADLLKKLSRALPYTLRVDRREAPVHVLNQNQVSIAGPTVSVRDPMRLVVAVLPEWQATHFPSHIILYQEQVHYSYGEVIAT